MHYASAIQAGREMKSQHFQVREDNKKDKLHRYLENALPWKEKKKKKNHFFL